MTESYERKLLDMIAAQGRLIDLLTARHEAERAQAVRAEEAAQAAGRLCVWLALTLAAKGA